MREVGAERRALRRVGAIGLGVAVLTGCGLGGGPDRHEETGELLAAADLNAFDLRVGDCLAEFDAETEVSTVPAVPCGEPHVGEIYASLVIPDGDFPGGEAVVAYADERCTTEFATFIGLEFAESQLSVRYFTPTEASWDDGDREVLCIVADDGMPTVTGTLAGAAR